jgi:hypothetical protein
MDSLPKTFDERSRKVLVCEKTHLRGNRVGAVLVREIAGVGQAS